jgi:hypothetical protein
LPTVLPVGSGRPSAAATRLSRRIAASRSSIATNLKLAQWFG